MEELTAYDDWKSLFTDDVKIVWQQERRELRRFGMILHIMRQEFNRIEKDFQCEKRKFHERYKLRDDNQKSEKVPGSHESPTLNKRRPTKLVSNSPSLLNIPKDRNVSSRNDNKRQIESVILDSSSEGEDITPPTLKPKNLFRIPIGSKTPDDDTLVDCSVVIDETPNNLDTKRSRPNDIKWIQTKNRKALKENKISKMILSASKKRRHQHKPVSFDNDQTYFEPLEKDKIDLLPKFNAADDYDLVPKPKSYSPEHVHKTEAVRKKAERMKLPGWSCADCEKFYEALDLSPTRLKQKMDACSKHRNKFPPLNETPQGYWDITMPPTQDAT